MRVRRSKLNSHHVRLVFVGVSASLVCMIANMEGVKYIHEGVRA